MREDAARRRPPPTSSRGSGESRASVTLLGAGGAAAVSSDTGQALLSPGGLDPQTGCRVSPLADRDLTLSDAADGAESRGAVPSPKRRRIVSPAATAPRAVPLCCTPSRPSGQPVAYARGALAQQLPSAPSPGGASSSGQLVASRSRMARAKRAHHPPERVLEPAGELNAFRATCVSRQARAAAGRVPDCVVSAPPALPSAFAGRSA